MLKCIIWSQTRIRLPSHALINEVNEKRILTVHEFSQWPRTWFSHLAFWIRSHWWGIIIVKEYLPSWCHDYKRPWRQALYFHNTRHLLFFIFACEKRKANIEFVEDADKRPHIYSRSIFYAKHDFWGSIKPGLDVCIKLVTLESATTEVDDFDSAFVCFSQQNVFRFHIAMNNIVFAHEMKSNKKLNGKSSDETYTYSLKVVALDKLV